MKIKTLISGICILLAICLAIYFFAEWQKARFDAALPVPPAPPAEEQTGGHWHDGEWHADDAHDNDTGGELIPSVDWQPSTGRPHEAAKPEGFDKLDAEDPVAKAWAKVDYIADNPFAWGGNADPRTAALVQQLMPPIMYFESEAHAEEILGLLDKLARLQDPRAIETLVVNMCEGPGSSRLVLETLGSMGPPVVPYLLPYLEAEDESSMGVFIAAKILGQTGAQHRADLDGIVEHIILPKLEKQLEKALANPFPTESPIRAMKEAIARLKR